MNLYQNILLAIDFSEHGHYVARLKSPCFAPPIQLCLPTNFPRSSTSFMY